MGLFTTKRSDFESARQAAQAIPPAQHSAAADSTISSRQEISIPPELMARHEESLRQYPRVHLSKGEYVAMEVRRHPIGLISIWALIVVLVVLTVAILPFYSMNRESIASIFSVSLGDLPTAAALTLPIFALAALFLLGGLVAVYVYNSNLFYLTNESIIQYIQSSIFSTKEQQINLVNIDDVSYRQQGILQQVLNYGTVRVSTEGDERNPYVFYFVAKPQLVVRTINDAMEEATGFAVRYRQHKQNIDTADPTLPPPEKF
jgi:uncharacterized membrane protein YdbT with pleckstrin-like domain